MRGEILHYDVSQGIGFISGDDGNRYMFSRNDLQQSKRVGKGTKIDFRVDGQNAREVFIIDPRGPAASAQSVPSVGGDPVATIAPQTATAQAGSVPPAVPPYAGQPQFATPDRGLFEHFLTCCTSGYANFRGRARRKEYWGFVLFYILALFAAGFAGAAVDGALGNFDSDAPYVTGILVGLAFLYFIVPTLAVTVRRFHDVGLSGWLYLLFVVLSVIYIGSIIIFVISLLPSQRHDNKWGPVPGGIPL